MKYALTRPLRINNAVELRAIGKAAFEAHPLATFEAWRGAAEHLWARARSPLSAMPRSR